MRLRQVPFDMPPRSPIQFIGRKGTLRRKVRPMQQTISFDRTVVGTKRMSAPAKEKVNEMAM